MVTRNARLVSAVGVAVWLVTLVVVPAPLAARVSLMVPLVVVPRLLLRLSERRSGAASSLVRLAGWPALLLALPLPVAFAFAPGPWAVVAAAPWLAVAGACGLAAAVDAIPRLGSIFRPASTPRLATDAALGFVAVGALFLAADRAGIRPLDFPAPIVLLTAVHFQVAGFGLLGLVALGVDATGAGSRPSRSVGMLATYGLVFGMPLTAAGFVLAAPVVNWAGSMVVASSALGAAGLLAAHAGSLRGRGRLALAVAAVALVVAMPLAIVYATGLLLGMSTLDLDLMVRTHGALNGTAVLLATLAWHSGDPR